MHFQFGAVLTLSVALVNGCRLFTHEEVPHGHSLLRPAQASPDSLTMEIIWVRFPAGDPQLNGEAWQDIDETQIAPSVRRELANNGFRAGVISGGLPDAVAQVLGQGAGTSDTAAATKVSQTVDLSTEPVVHGRVQQLRRNQRSEIQASEIYPSMPLLVNRGHEPLSGKIYQQAQAVYALRIDPQPDRTTVVELTPELHHGAPRILWTQGEDDAGISRLAPVRERVVFHRMRLSVRLAPAEILVLTSLPEAGSQLADYFHTVDSDDGRQQKLILIRLADVPPSDTFAGVAGD
jgi:hypothetical protein